MRPDCQYATKDTPVISRKQTVIKPSHIIEHMNNDYVHMQTFIQLHNLWDCHATIWDNSDENKTCFNARTK